MTSEFTKWAKTHEIEIPDSLYRAIAENHKQTDK